MFGLHRLDTEDVTTLVTNLRAGNQTRSFILDRVEKVCLDFLSSKEVWIHNDHLTIGEILDIDIYRDRFIQSRGGDALASSRRTLDHAQEFAKAAVIIKKGINESQQGNHGTQAGMFNFLKLPPEIIRLANFTYDRLLAPPMVKDQEEAKKKDSNE